MHTLVSGVSKDVVLIINDFYPELVAAIEKLSTYLKRPLKGVILTDKDYKNKGLSRPDTSGKLSEIVCDFSSISSVSKALEPIKDNILLVTCGSERSQPFFKKIIPHLPYLLTPTEHSLDWATHKSKMRELLHSFNPALVPKFMHITDNSVEHIKKIEEHISYPVIVKPNGLAASILVNKANDQKELEFYLSHGFQVMEKIYSNLAGRGEPSMIVEEFIDGDMYSVDAYVNNEGKVWILPLIRVHTGASIGINGYYSFRRDTHQELTETEVGQAYNATVQAIHALGLKSSVAHIELFHTKDGWKIIELGPRPGGYRQDMYYLAYGIDHAFNEFLLKIGEEPIMPTSPKAYASAINIYPDQEGVVTSVEGFEDAKENPSVYWLKLYDQPGDRVLFSGNGGKFVIDGVLWNKNLEQLNRDVDAIRKTIKVNTRPD